MLFTLSTLGLIFNISLDPFCPVSHVWKLSYFYWNQVQLFLYFVCMWDETWVSDFRWNGGRGEVTVKVCEGCKGWKSFLDQLKMSEVVETRLHISKADNTLLYTICWSRLLKCGIVYISVAECAPISWTFTGHSNLFASDTLWAETILGRRKNRRKNLFKDICLNISIGKDTHFIEGSTASDS